MLFGVWHLLKSQVFCASICLPIWALQRRIRGADFGTEAAFKASFCWWWIVRICWRSLLKGWPDLKWQGIDYVFLLKNLYSEFCAVFPSPWCCLLVLHSFFAICEWKRRQQERKRQAGEWETLSQWWSTNRKHIKFIIDKFHVYCSERTNAYFSPKKNERHRSYCTVVCNYITLHCLNKCIKPTYNVSYFPPSLLIGISAIYLILDMQEIAFKRTTQQKTFHCSHKISLDSPPFK